MLELHIWGSENKVSVISPESLASSWLLNIVFASKKESFQIVTSNNTNISDIDKLPVLVTEDNKKYHGYENISRYLIKETSESNIVIETKDELTNNALLNLYLTKLEVIHQFNLFINSTNYEKYTRKLFKEYFPFPMMYNQPLKFYNNAQDLVKAVGLQGNKPGFFSFTGADKTAQTEYFNDEIEDDEIEVEDQIAISALYERSMLAKSNQNSLLKEGKRNIKCLHLLEEYLSSALSIIDIKNSYAEFTTTSDILLCAYIYSMTHDSLPDRFLYNYLKIKFSKFLEYTTKRIDQLNIDLYANISAFREPDNFEVPSLKNEIAYTFGALSY